MIHRIPYNSPAWHSFRQNGIGGSEIGSVLGVDRFRCGLELFHQKLGLAPKPELNAAMAFGQMLEEKVAQAWQYWNGVSWLDNYAAGIKARACRRSNGYHTRPEWPWLFFSPDRIGYKPHRMYVECKCVNQMLHRQEDIRLAHAAQCQMGMMMLGMDRAELAMLIGGQVLEVVEFRADAELQKKILKRSREFWDRVEYARETIRCLGRNVFSAAELRREVSGCEPPVYEHEQQAWCEYIGEAYEPQDDEIINGSDYLFSIARKEREARAREKSGEVDKKKYQAILKKAMADSGVQGLSFNEAGKVTYKKDSNGTARFHSNVTT